LGNVQRRRKFHITVGRDNELVLPDAVMEELHLRPGDDVALVVSGNSVVLSGANGAPESSYGLLYDPKRAPFSDDELEAAIEAAANDRIRQAAEDDARIVSEYSGRD